jgi:hypothetical protein
MVGDELCDSLERMLEFKMAAGLTPHVEKEIRPHNV